MFLLRATLGYVIIWIMSQRILVKQRGTLRSFLQRTAQLTDFAEAAEKYTAEKNMLEFSGYKLDSCREINNALRSQGNYKSRSLFADPFKANPLTSMTRSFNRNPVDTVDDEFSVEVHVEKSVSQRVCHDPSAFEREDYRQHRVIWDETTVPQAV